MTIRVPVDLGAVSANTGSVDSNGVLWKIATLKGWDSPDIEQRTDGITGHHGLALLSSQYAGRTIVATGSARTPNPAACWAAHDLITSLVDLVTPTTLTVHETPASKSLSVIKNGPPLVSLRPGLTGISFSLSLQALSPFKRGVTQTVTIAAGASATVTYAGSQPGAPTITTTAPGTVDLANATTGTRIRTTEAVPSGTEIVCAEPGHTVYAGTSNLYGALIQPVSWLRLMKGANVLTNAGSAPVSISIPDLYL